MSHASSPALPFRDWAATPPMGWNSWDCFGTTVTEAQVRAQADFMADNLARHGFSYVVVDIQWYEPSSRGFQYRSGAPLTLDEWGRLWPAPNRFPSSVGSVGFRALADYVHERGLKFGVHLLRGIPRLAVERDLPILGASQRASEIADRTRVCAWNPDMFGVDMSRPGAQAYYDSVLALLASWGVDFLKVDDISRPYHDNELELEAIRRAIDATGRPIVLSLSPGETALSAAAHVTRHANMWRISDDFWDDWFALREQFGRLARWNEHRAPGVWPDADMLPLGVLACGTRSTRFTPDEQVGLLTLWCIARSPLMHGGDLTRTDELTLSLLTNDEVLAVNQRSANNRPLFDEGGFIAWIADVPDSPDKYLALFNARERVPLGAERASASRTVGPQPESELATLEVDLRGAALLVLVTDDGDANQEHPVAVWADPEWVLADGSRRAVRVEEATRASAWWGDTVRERQAPDAPFSVLGAPISRGFGGPARLEVAFSVPEGCVGFQARVGRDDASPPQATCVRFMAHAVRSEQLAPATGSAIAVDLRGLGFPHGASVRDLWEHRELGTFEQDFAPLVPWHGARLYLISPRGERSV